MPSTKKEVWALVLYSDNILSEPIPLRELQDLRGRNGEEANLQVKDECMAPSCTGDEMCRAIIIVLSENLREIEHIRGEILRESSGQNSSDESSERKSDESSERKTKIPKVLKILGMGVVTGAVAVVAAPLVLTAVGFSSGGIVAGSLAAKMMSMAAIANGGGVAAGGVIATLQSAGAAGISTAASAAIGTAAGAVGSGTALAASKLMEKKTPEDE